MSTRLSWIGQIMNSDDSPHFEPFSDHDAQASAPSRKKAAAKKPRAEAVDASQSTLDTLAQVDEPTSHQVLPVPEPVLATAAAEGPSASRTGAVDERVSELAQSVDEMNAKPPEGLLYGYTNTMNLFEILATGYLGPRESFPKSYFPDLLELCPGSVPLCAGALDTEALQAVADGEKTFPVALEIETPQGYAAGPGLVHLARGVVPLARVKRILFRTERELKDHHAKLRAFADIPALSIECSIDDTGALAGSGPVTLEILRSSSSERDPESRDLVEVYRRYDRYLGGIAVMSRLTSPRPPKLTSALGALGLWNVLDEDGSVDWEKAGRLLPTALGLSAADTDLFKLVLESLVDIDPRKEWRAVEVLDSFKQRAELLPSLGADVASRLDNMRAVLKDQADMPVFEVGHGSEVLRAFMGILKRPQPDKLVPWADGWNRLGLDSIAATSGFFVGLMEGFRSLSAGFKPGGLVLACGEWVADAFAPPQGDGRESFGSAVSASDSGLTVLVSGNRSGIVVERSIEAAELWRWLIPEDFDGSEGEAIAREWAENAGLTSCWRTEWRLKEGAWNLMLTRAGSDAVLISLPGKIDPTFTFVPAAFKSMLTAGEAGVPGSSVLGQMTARFAGDPQDKTR